MVALNITDDARQKALLLHYMGDETNDIFDTLTVPDPTDDQTTMSVAIQALTDHFAPKQNIEYEIYKFRQAQQHKDEEFSTFLTHLRQLSINCNFHEVDRELKTQIIQGCSSSRLRQKALSDPSMTLVKLIETARATEVADHQASGMESKPVVQTVQQGLHGKVTPNFKLLKKPFRKKPDAGASCWNCGRQWPHDGGKQSCPALGKTCRSCQKLDHFDSVCRSKSRSHPHPEPQRFKTSSASKWKLNEVHLKETSDSDDECVYSVSQSKSHVKETSDSEDGYIYSIGRSNSPSQPRFAIKINGSPVTVIADSGASVNILDEKDFQRTCHQSGLSLTKIEIFPYGSNIALPILGKFEADVEYNSHRTSFFVVKGSTGSLLSWDTSTKLRMIEIVREVKVTSQPVEHNTSEAECIKLTEEYADIFQGLGKLKDFKVQLHIDNSIQPCAQPHRRVPFHVRKQLEKQLLGDEERDVIERVNDQTPWVSPLVVVPKPKSPGEIRVCVDMRRANQAIKRERHITPTINEIIHDLNGACIFSKLDLNQGYNQLELDESSRYITTFSSHLGLWRYKRLSFGINSAAEVFQNAIRVALSDLKGVCNISDDILVYGRTPDEHNTNLRNCFQRIRDRGLTLNKTKCVFSKSSLDFFGHTFTEGGMRVDPKKVEAVVNLSNPSNQTEIRSLLGMTNFFSRFIPHYATITEPLRLLTHKQSKWQWSAQHDHSFDQLRKALSSAPTLVYFDETKTTSLFVDASPVGLAAILTQSAGKDHAHQTVSYASRAVTAVEQRYSQTEREALAVIWAGEHFHVYIFGKPITIYTDHKPLVSLYGNPNSKPPARIERWSLRLQPYDALIVYRPGSHNPADYMSRHPVVQIKSSSREEKIAEEYINYLTNVLVPKAMTLEEVRLATQHDATLQEVIRAIKTNVWHNTVEHPVNKQSFDAYKKIKEELSVNFEEGVVLRERRIVIPETLHKRAIQLAHEGHQGLTKTKALVREKIWFPGIDKMVEDLIGFCLPCQVATPKLQREPFKMSDLPKAAWTEVSVDFAQLDSGYLLIIVDEYSRFPIVEIVSSTSANVVIPKLDKIFSEHGIVEILKSDNGPPFNSHNFAQFAKELGFHHRKITPLWPRANAEVERFVKTIKKVIKTATVNQSNWIQEMHHFLRNYRATPHCTTGVAPASLFYHRQLNTKLPHIINSSNDEELRRVETVIGKAV